MAKSSSSRSKSSSRRRGSAGDRPAGAKGKHLVIVESPAKAKTINRYLGPGYTVQASVGHVRDLPRKAPKGSKQPVPGVDLDNHFEPTYVVLPTKRKTLTALKQAAREAADVWFATDLDREGEAIAWHLAQELGIEPTEAKRVIFNAITRSQIEHAFANPHAIDLFKVNAQQARRILDRIVGYQVSPLLWKKVARGLSAGRVQSVALRLAVEREREIRAFIPSEYWKVTGRMCLDPETAPQLAEAWSDFVRSAGDNTRGKGPTVRTQNAWLAERRSLKAELVELDGAKFELGRGPDDNRDLSAEVRRVAEAAGLENVSVTSTDVPDGKGPAATRRTVQGTVSPRARYRVSSIQTKRTASKPPPPFITASLQAAAASSMGFGAQRTMRVAQALYEGVTVRGEGQLGLITYMRTDSTHLADEALEQVRAYVRDTCGDRYVPAEPNRFDRSEKAQEAHEAIRPTDVRLHPDQLRSAVTDEQYKLYRLIWSRFAACQMMPAQWDVTTALLHRDDEPTGAVFKASGRVLVFDGFYRLTGVPTNGEEQLLPELAESQQLAPFSIDADQLFTNPPPRYTEASLVKALEADGIGRPSTYAQIIEVIQDRKYVEQIDRRFYATDLGEIVTDKLVEAFPKLMDLSYTGKMEAELDKIEDQHTDWTTMLEEFYKRFSTQLEKAHDTIVHAKAETQPAPYKCPTCGSPTCYRFGKNGRFLSCTAYPKCDYAAPIDREGNPLLPQRINVACPADNSPMVLRNGRFGPFLASVNYPDVDDVINIDKKGQIKYPSPPPLLTDIACPKCDAPLNLRRGKRGPWLGCSTFPKCKGRSGWAKLDQAKRDALLKELEAQEKTHPPIIIRDLNGAEVPAGTPVADLILPGGVAELDLYEPEVPRAKSA
ncbi:MAG: DNA topoisomerase family protein [Planctomycetota bacterium]|jgi:DNA topoisomerase-1